MRYFKNAAVHFTYLSINRENGQKLKERAESDSILVVWLNPAADIFPSISQTTRRSCTFCNNCLYLGGRGKIWIRHQWKTAIRGNPTNYSFFSQKLGLVYRARNEHQLGYLNKKHIINLLMGWCSPKRKFLLKLPEKKKLLHPEYYVC